MKLRKIISREDHLPSHPVKYRGLEHVHCKPFEYKTELPLLFNDSPYPIQAPHYKIVNNGLILGSFGVVLTRSLRFVNESTLGNFADAKEHALNFTFSHLNLSLTSLIFKRPKAYTVVSMLSFWRGYFHFVLEGLTRLRAVEEYKKSTGEDVLVLIEKDAPKWKTRYLEILGYPEEKLIYIDNQIHSFKKVIAPSFSRSDGRTSASDCKWLRDSVLKSPIFNPKVAITKGQRIYISRHQASKRRLVNEDEILKLLEPVGFTTLTLENLNVDDQAAALASAEVIIAPHGAGLTNIIYSKHCRIIELLPTEYQIGCFYRLATALGFDYIGLQCEDVGEDVMAPILDIKEALYAYGIESL